MENEKWLMFKNYMHNELGITKEDIRTWIEEAVQQQAEALVKNEFKKFDINKVVSSAINDEKYFGSKQLKREISDAFVQEIMKKMKFD